MYGQIVEVVHTIGRYSLKLADNKQLKVKWENVLV
jgi:hypothetical protein